VWLTAAVCGSRLYGRLRRAAPLGVAVSVVIALSLWLALGPAGDANAQSGFTPTDPPNQPVGVAQGIHPGRVVWVEAPEAARWAE
jgi:hypothetical protein